MPSDPVVLFDLIKEYGFVLVIAVFLSWQQYQDKKSNSKELEAYRKFSSERLQKLEHFQTVEVVRQKEELIKVIERSNTCIEESAKAMRSLVQAVINK